MPFKYEEKDSYTSEDIKKILSQHETYVSKEKVDKTKYKELEEKYKPLAEKEEKAIFVSDMKKKLEKEGITDFDKVLKYGGFDPADDKKTFKEKLSKIKEDLPNLFLDQKGLDSNDFKSQDSKEDKTDYASLGIYGSVKG